LNRKEVENNTQYLEEEFGEIIEQFQAMIGCMGTL